MGRQRFSHWLRRAGSAPLDVNITYYGRIPRSQPAAPMRDMFIELFERAPQWRDVELASSVQDLAQKWVASALAGKLDTLERLRLQVLDRDDGNGLITVFSQAPNLREVSLGYLPLGRIALPWAQLTSLTVAEVSVRACVQVLQLTPRLTSFQLDGIMGELDNLALLAPLPNLKSFLLDYDDPNHTEDSVHIFRVLTIPNLTTLKLYQYGEGHQYVIDFLSRSSPAGLHKLLLRGPCDFLSDALPLMPTLADIEIEKLHAFQATAFLKTLHDSAAATHLQSITIHITTGHPASVDSLDYHVLVDTLTALKAHGLRSFRLTWHTNVDDIGLRPGWGVVERLSELVEDGGMHIYVGTTKQSWM
ncbi:hypothetical protein C8R44DRAFT_9053 [Mycena epipterygia]|nr:hypothetical protein C8R44DRAFT_9053 [Mycena epipterygia]